MAIARERFLNDKANFAEDKAAFQALPHGQERAEATPGFRSAHDQFQSIRDWFRGLQDMTPGQAKGMAQFGPPIPWGAPKLAEPMAVPQFPGMAQHDGTIRGLLGILQQQTAGGAAGGGGGGGSSTDGSQIITTPDGTKMTQAEWDAYQAQWTRPQGWSGNPNVSGK
jgi:hypothetical protein